MANLLPKKEKDFIKKEYLIRLIIVFLSLLMVSMLLFVVFLIPSYISLVVKENTAIEQINLVKKSVQNKDNAEVEKKLNLIMVKTAVLKRYVEETSLGDVIYAIVKNKPNGIYISDILYNKIQKKDAIEKVITVQGTSETRDELLVFKESLIDVQYFKEVNLPLSNLTKDSDVSFLINIILKDDKKTN
ncbi:MAG: hypothetical protein Athens071416_201 [Parcubacteria group bacterium Athens0714_16]|nr:MAG: hypothetical protein Athens071416_201 [Parcubacteria group bacterium Athens0714_16]